MKKKNLINVRNVLNKAFWCNVCNKQFKSKGSLKKHEVTVHRNADIFNNNVPKCNFCGKVYSHKDALKKHIKMKHDKYQTLA